MYEACLNWKPGQDLPAQLGKVVLDKLIAAGANPLGATFMTASIAGGLRSFGSTPSQIAMHLFEGEHKLALEIGRNLG